MEKAASLYSLSPLPLTLLDSVCGSSVSSSHFPIFLKAAK